MNIWTDLELYSTRGVVPLYSQCIALRRWCLSPGTLVSVIAPQHRTSSINPIIQAPLLLPIFSLLPDIHSNPIPTAIFYFLVDLVNAYALVTISESGQSIQSRLHSAVRKHIQWDGVSVAAWYTHSMAPIGLNKIPANNCIGSSLIPSRLLPA